MIWWIDKSSENIITIVNNKILGKAHIWQRFLVARTVTSLPVNGQKMLRDVRNLAGECGSLSERRVGIPYWVDRACKWGEGMGFLIWFGYMKAEANSKIVPIKQHQIAWFQNQKRYFYSCTLNQKRWPLFQSKAAAVKNYRFD